MAEDLPELVEHGDSGTRRSGGRITGYEKNPRIGDFASWAGIVDEMFRTDPKLAEVQQVLDSVTLSAEWFFEPGPAVWGKDARLRDAALRLAEQFNAQWGFDGGSSWFDVPWERQLTSLLRYVRVGARYAEELYGVRNGQVYLKQYADREPQAHQSWEWEGNTWSGVKQYNYIVNGPKVGKELFIPADKLLLLTRGMTGDNLEGIGAARPAYQWFNYKQHALDLLAIAAERWAVPTPHVQTNRQAAADAGYTKDQIDRAVAEAKTVAERYLAGEQAWLSSIVGVDFKTFGDGRFDPQGLLASIGHANQEMLSAFLMAFLEMGLGEVGSRALGQVLQEQGILAIVNILDLIASAINGKRRAGGGTVGRLIGWNDKINGENPEVYPVLRHRGIAVSKLAALLPHLANLVTANLLTPDDDLENELRSIGGMRGSLSVSRSYQERMQRESQPAMVPTGGRGSPPSVVE